MGRKQTIPPDMIQAVLERRAAGMTQLAIANELNIKVQKVGYIQRRAAWNGNPVSIEAEEVTIPKSTAGYRSFIAKAQQSREDAIDALWNWRTIENNVSSEIAQIAIDAATGAANAWRKTALDLESRRKNK